jgi:hypothetical protein
MAFCRSRFYCGAAHFQSMTAMSESLWTAGSTPCPKPSVTRYSFLVWHCLQAVLSGLGSFPSPNNIPPLWVSE